jgi:hypothetical protein
MRRLLAPRLLGIHALGVLGIALCLFLSSWQWNRAHTPAPATAAIEYVADVEVPTNTP